jgi:hypothetical protein
LASRRRRASRPQAAPDRRSQATARQGASGPESSKGGTDNPALDSISKPPVADDDLHFKTGRMGRLARFFVRLRAAGDPLDETIILPALIVVTTMRLNDLDRLDAWTVAAAVVATGIMAGAWLGASLGAKGIFRAVLRSISVGAIESAGYALIYAGKFNFSSAVAGNFILLNLLMYLYASLLAAQVRSVAITTEKDWQGSRARLAPLYKLIFGGERMEWRTSRARLSSFRRFIRMVLGAEKLEGASTTVAFWIQTIRFILPLFGKFLLVSALTLLALWMTNILGISHDVFVHPDKLFQSSGP